MPFLVCVVPVCPVRAEASHRSEQVSQLLFGEVGELMERTKDFVKVRALYDHYEGWCQENQLVESQQEPQSNNLMLAGEWVNEITMNDKLMRIPFGSTLPANNLIGNNKVDWNSKVIDVKINSFSVSKLEEISFLFLNTPYLWGGRSVFGIDCSGFSQIVFRCLNVPLLRDASQQVTQGDEVGFLQEAKPGDLAFFDNEAGKIVHVGILLTTDSIIHASGKVRIDTIDNLGIINGDTGQRTHKLRLIKRIITSSPSLLF